jgi:Putative transmembrane protein (PGPGW)
MGWITEGRERLGLNSLPRNVRKHIVGVIGVTVLIFGLALIILPGPATVVIPVGLAILASEFAWARRIIRRGRIIVGKVRRDFSGSRAVSADDQAR